MITTAKLLFLVAVAHALAASPSTQTADQEPSKKIVRRPKAESVPTAPLPASCTKLVFDVGTNTGADTLAFLKSGRCVIGVDANPNMLREARKKVVEYLGDRAEPDHVRLINRGISQQSGELTFYDTPYHITSSFDYKKALENVRGKAQHLRHLLIKTEPCQVNRCS